MPLQRLEEGKNLYPPLVPWLSDTLLGILIRTRTLDLSGAPRYIHGLPGLRIYQTLLILFRRLLSEGCQLLTALAQENAIETLRFAAARYIRWRFHLCYSCHFCQFPAAYPRTTNSRVL